jgi:hypothetical protein
MGTGIIFSVTLIPTWLYWLCLAIDIFFLRLMPENGPLIYLTFIHFESGLIIHS